MSNSVVVKLNKANVRKLLSSENIKNFDEQIASEIVSRAGEGYEYRSHLTEQRVITNIYPATPSAAHDNFENNTLIRSLR